MKKKNIIIISILLVVLVISYFIYKGVSLYIYTTTIGENYDEVTKGLKIKDTLTIKNQIIPEEEYLIFNNIKIKNVFEKFKENDNRNDIDDYIEYLLYDDDNKLIASFGLGKLDFTWIGQFSGEGKQLYETDFKYFNEVDRANILNKNNIKNDIDLIKYLAENKDNRYNIFSSMKKMKENYAIKYFSYNILPILESYTLIEGDYIGYGINYTSTSSKIREFSILHSNEKYLFTFMWKDDYFNDEKIKDLLATIVID